ncbi:MAG: hypothetical protein ABH863_02015 [Candidatus Micrarchaeota archaeon]
MSFEKSDDWNAWSSDTMTSEKLDTCGSGFEAVFFFEKKKIGVQKETFFDLRIKSFFFCGAIAFLFTKRKARQEVPVTPF